MRQVGNRKSSVVLCLHIDSNQVISIHALHFSIDDPLLSLEQIGDYFGDPGRDSRVQTRDHLFIKVYSQLLVRLILDESLLLGSASPDFNESRETTGAINSTCTE